MKYGIIFLLSFVFFCCCNVAHKAVSEQPAFDFDTWKNNTLLDFNKMVAADSIANIHKRINKKMIINEINILDKKTFEYNFEKALGENKMKQWSNVYILYHFLEGEFNHGLSSYVFFNGKRYWGSTYDHNNGKYYQVDEQYAKVIAKIKPNLYGGGNGLAIISKFDRSMKNPKTVIVAGVSYSEELEPLMKIYDDKIFD